MIALMGTGWLDEQCYGHMEPGTENTYADPTNLYRRLLDRCIVEKPMRHFGRMHPSAQKVCLAVALALSECEGGAETGTVATGIIGTSRHGCQAVNVEYYRDYLLNGRQLGRGSLFAATLPTTTLAQAAIHFKFRGPLLHVATGRSAIAGLLTQAAGLMARDGCGRMVTVWEFPPAVLCAVVKPTDDSAGKTALKAACRRLTGSIF
jgi:hypothetical protein